MGCIILEDPVLGIKLETYTQSIPLLNECVNQLQFETPIDYPERNSGYSVTIGGVMSQKLNVPHEEWHFAYSGVHRKQIILEAAKVLANLYKNRLAR